MTTFYLVRHAEKDGPSTLLSGRPPGVGLTEPGRLQAERIADVLATMPIRRILSSPLARARQTASPTAQRLALDVECSEALGDIDYGEWTSRTAESLESNVEWQQFLGFRSGKGIPGGELLLDVQGRFVGEMLRLRTEMPEGSVALFSHSDPIKLAIAYFGAVPLDCIDRFDIDTASISTLTLTDWGPRIHGINRRVDPVD